MPPESPRIYANPMKRIAIAFAILAASAGIVAASCGHRRVVVKEAVVAAVVTPVAVATFVPVAVASYGAGYAPQAAVQSDPALIAEVKALRAEIAAQKQTAPRPTPAAPQDDAPPVVGAPAAAPGHLEVYRNRCSTCHDASTKNKGGGLVLTIGNQLAALTAEQSLEVLRRVDLPKGDPERMPRGGADLSDEEFSRLLAGVTRRR